MFFYEEKKNYYYYLSSSSSSSSSLNKYRGNQTSARQKGRSFGPRTRWFRIFDVVCFSFLRSSFPLAFVIKSEHPSKIRPSLRHFWTSKTKMRHTRKRFSNAMEDAPASHGASSFDENTTTTIGAVKFEKVATLLEWIKAYRKKARKTSKKAMARKYLDRFFAAHYPQFFTRERTGMFPLYRLLAPQVREHARGVEGRRVVFCARLSRGVLC